MATAMVFKKKNQSKPKANAFSAFALDFMEKYRRRTGQRYPGGMASAINDPDVSAQWSQLTAEEREDWKERARMEKNRTRMLFAANLPVPSAGYQDAEPDDDYLTGGDDLPEVPYEDQEFGHEQAGENDTRASLADGNHPNNRDSAMVGAYAQNNGFGFSSITSQQNHLQPDLPDRTFGGVSQEATADPVGTEIAPSNVPNVGAVGNEAVKTSLNLGDYDYEATGLFGPDDEEYDENDLMGAIDDDEDVMIQENTNENDSVVIIDNTISSGTHSLPNESQTGSVSSKNSVTVPPVAETEHVYPIVQENEAQPDMGSNRSQAGSTSSKNSQRPMVPPVYESPPLSHQNSEVPDPPYCPAPPTAATVPDDGYLPLCQNSEVPVFDAPTATVAHDYGSETDQFDEECPDAQNFIPPAQPVQQHVFNPATTDTSLDIGWTPEFREEYLAQLQMPQGYRGLGRGLHILQRTADLESALRQFMEC